MRRARAAIVSLLSFGAVASTALVVGECSAHRQPPAAACVPRVIDGPPAAAAETQLLGTLRAPYELHAPAQRPRGVMILLHGGGWVDIGPGQMDFVRRTLLPTWLAHGWAVVIVGYRGCGASLGDVVEAYDAVRRLTGPRTPIGLTGESAGAHLALLTAAERPDAAVVIARAGPTNAATLARGLAVDGTGMSNRRPRELAAGWRGAFGERAWLTTANPYHRARDIRARVLLAQSTWDPVIPSTQLHEMADALRSAHPRRWVGEELLQGGPVPFVHIGITPEAMSRYNAAEIKAIAPWQTGPPHTPHTVAGWWADTQPIWGGPANNDGTGRQCAAAPVLTRLARRGANITYAGHAMPGSPVTVRAGRRTATIATGTDGRFHGRQQLHAGAPPRRLLITQRSSDTTRARAYELPPQVSVRIADATGGIIRVDVRHATARRIGAEVVGTNGCSRVAPPATRNDRGHDQMTLRATPGALVIATSNGQSSLAQVVK